MKSVAPPPMFRSTVRWMIVVPISVLLLLLPRVNAFVISHAGYTPIHHNIRSRSSILVLSSTTTKLNEDEDTTKQNSQSSPSQQQQFLPDYGTTPIEIDQIKIIKKKWRRPELLGQSLIEQTMNEITNQSSNENNNSATLINVPLTKEERIAQRRSLQQAKSVPNFEQHVHAMAAAASTTTTSSSSPLQLLNRKSIPTILQIKIGLYCNQACQHCHGT